MSDPVSDPGMPPNERIRLYRRRRGLTQPQAAQLMGCSLSLWRKYENGERQVSSLADWIEIARILRVTDLFKLTGLPVAQLPDEPAEHESIPPIRVAMHRYIPKIDVEPNMGRLARSVEYAWNVWHGSASRYSETGALLPDLITETRATILTLDGSERRDAQRVAATMYLLVRAFAKRIGSLDIALLAADRAMVAADEADDPHYRAAAAWNAAVVMSTRGYSEEAIALCRDAIDDLLERDDQDPERIALLGELNLLLAIQHARVNEERFALDALEHAQQAAAATGETNYHRLVFGPTNVAIHRSTVSLEMSRPGEALRIAERVDVTDMPSIERRYTHYLDLARAYTQQKDDLAAVHMLQRADKLCPEESKVNLTFHSTVRQLLVRENANTRPDLRPLAHRIGLA